MDWARSCGAYCGAAVRMRSNDERGASVVEYALLLVLIAVVCVAGITLVGDATGTRLSSSASRIP